MKRIAGIGFLPVFVRSYGRYIRRMIFDVLRLFENESNERDLPEKELKMKMLYRQKN